jgi:hypothetical protein
MQDGAAAMRPHMAELNQVYGAVGKVLGQLNDQILDKVAALNTNLALNAFALPPPPPSEAKANFDEYTSGVFKLLKAWQAQSEKIRAKVRGKTDEVLQQFSSQFASQVNQAMEIERKNWKEEARAREREAAEKLKQSRAAMTSESRSASRGAESVALQEEELAKRSARIKELEATALANEVQHREDEDTISILRAKTRELQGAAASLEGAERSLADAKAKLSEQDGLLESYRGQIKDGERSLQKIKGGGSAADEELKLLRKKVAAAEREAQEQSKARADMQDRLQEALDALSEGGGSGGGGGGGGGASSVESTELRRQVAELQAQLADAKVTAAATFVPIPSPPPERRGLGQMTAEEMREELTVFIERLVDAKAGAVDVGIEGVTEELTALGRQLRHLLPAAALDADGGADGGGTDGQSISPKSTLLGVRAATPTTDELDQKLKQAKQQLAVSETEVKSLTKQMGFVAEGRRVAEQEAKKMKDELAQLRKEKAAADAALEKLANAARTEERSEARQEAKAARAEKGEMGELRRLADKYKQAEATALAKLQAAKEFATKYQEEKNGLAVANKQLTKQLKDLLAQHQKELVQLSKAAQAESSAAAQSEQERAKSREGRAQAMDTQAQMWENALRDEHERGQAALQNLQAENAGLQETVAQLQARAAAAEGGLAQIGSQLGKKDALIQQKDGQIQRLVTACGVLEQKVRAMSGGGGGGGGDGEGGGEGGPLGGSSSLITVDNLSAAAGMGGGGGMGGGMGGGGGKRCAMCGGHAQFDRSLEAATSSGFLPSSTTTALREMTRFGTTAKWAPSPEPAKPGHYEDGTQAASNSMAIADVSNSLLLGNGDGTSHALASGPVGTMGTGPSGREADAGAESEPAFEPEPEPEWLRGDDGWYFGDVDGEGETMCWMASRRLSSPERSAAERAGRVRSLSALGHSSSGGQQQAAGGGGGPGHPRLQLTNNSGHGNGYGPPRSQSVGLPPLGDKAAQAQGVSWAAEAHVQEVSMTVSKNSLQLDVPAAVAPNATTTRGGGGGRGAPQVMPQSGGGVGGKQSIAATAAQQQAARLPRLAGHLHVPPAALQQAQAQVQKGQVY